jgi:uncharacterized protein YcnI
MPITSAQQAAEVLTFTRTAQCAFLATPDRDYTYKVPEGMDLKPLDEVVVESPKGLAVVRVVSVNGPERVDPHAKFEYKWLMQVVDRSGDTARKEALEFLKGPKSAPKLVDGQIVSD